VSADETTRLSEHLSRRQRTALNAGGVGVVVLAVGYWFDPLQFFRSYLLAWLFWLAPALGSLALYQLHGLTGGAWGFAIRRFLEAGLRTLPVIALLFLPLLFSIHALYEWSHADVVAEDPLLQRKAPYLNVPFWIARAVLYFAIWILLARRLLRLSERYDRTIHPRYLRRMRTMSALGTILYVVTMSLAAVDWGMSLEPHWFSTIYGVQFVVGQVLSVLCIVVVAASRLRRHEPFSRWLDEHHFHDLGNLMLAFVMLWAYMAFSQFLITWSGNLPEEVTWYVRRTGEGWRWVALGLVVLHFAVPFVLLLIRRTKQSSERLALLAMALFALRVVDYYWLIVPAFHPAGPRVSWLDVVALATIGALWLGWFLRALRNRPLVSLQDAKLLRRLEEAPGV
jgi:hypothetical protein